MVCLDTSVIIDIIRGKRSIEEIKNKFDSIEEEIFIPSPAIIEITRGIYLRENIRNIKEDEKNKINNFLSSFTILDLDKESAMKTGEIEAELNNNGEVIDLEDIMMGAIALQNNQKIITKNTKHFGRIKNLKIESY